jgi:hypothetical protein
MVDIATRARAELELRRRRSLQATPSHLAHIPKDWPSFARMTRIRSGTTMIPFDPYPFQESISDLIDQCRGVVIVKPRQHGLTEMVASKFLHKACLHPTYFAAVFSKGQDDTANIARRVRLMSASAGIPLASNNVKDISVEGGGRIVFRTASQDSGRGLESVWDILYDEAGFVNGIEEIYGAATPSQSLPEQQGKAHTILLSTPNAKQGLYYDTFVENNGKRDALDICRQMREEAIAPYQEWVDEQGWGKAVIHWRAHPIHGLNDDYLAEVKEKQRITENQVQREFNISFDDSTGGVLFSAAAVDRQAIGGWAEPVSGHRYVIGVDPNFGGDDRFVAQVWDLSGGVPSLVAEYAEAQRSVELSTMAVLDFCDRYKPVLVAVEGNSGGKVVLENLSKRRPFVRFENINTSRVSKVTNTDRIAIAVEQSEAIYPKDWEGVREMKYFSLREREAITGHDDRVMAMAMAFAVLDAASVTSRISYGAPAIW